MTADTYRPTSGPVARTGAASPLVRPIAERAGVAEDTLISVCIVCRNEADRLVECLESVFIKTRRVTSRDDHFVRRLGFRREAVRIPPGILGCGRRLVRRAMQGRVGRNRDNV